MAPRDGSKEREVVTLEQSHPAPVLGASFRLEVVDGPSRGERCTIEPGAGPAFLGQSGDCTIRLADRKVSRRHLRLEASGGVLRLTDLDSTNGTLVNDVAVLEARLRGGELICIGDSVVRVDRGPDRPKSTRSRTRFRRLIGASEAMQPVYRAIEHAAQTAACVVIEGDVGTGKELAAETLHEAGPRARGPLVVVRASALAASDGAVHDPEDSLLAAAAGGTLVLQDVTELSPVGQQALRERVERLRRTSGAAAALAGHNDVRLLTTSVASLDLAVEEGRFDGALADLLTESRIELPPLRRRKGDVELLTAHFWNAFGGEPGRLPTEHLKRMASARWPGNVAELQLEVARLVASAMDGTDASPVSLDDLTDPRLSYTRARQRMLDRFERMYVQRVLARADGNVSKAAEAAGIARRYFQIVKSRHHL
jgi:DNA-binding NtrC family response regulator